MHDKILLRTIILNFCIILCVYLNNSELMMFVYNNMQKSLQMILQQNRNYWMLKRKIPLPLSKKGKPPRQLYGRHHIYDLLYNSSSLPQPKIDLILTQYIEGIGNVGDLVSVKEKMAYNKFLLPKLAVYATPENLKKYNCASDLFKDIDAYNSTHLQNTIRSLCDKPLMIFMSDQNPWTLQAKHIAMYYRMAGVYVNESSIELPPEPITGPLKNTKILDITFKIKVSKITTIDAKCRIYSWNKESLDDLTVITRENYFVK